MAYLGTQDGMRVYDYLDEVPDSIIESNQKFIVMSPPNEMIENNAMIMTHDSPLAPAMWIILKIAALCILVAIVGHYFVNFIMQTGYALQGRPGQKIDDNMFEGGDGSVWVRDPETGVWTMVKGATINIMWIWAIVAIFIIAVVIIILLKRKELFGEKAAPKESKKTGSTKKNNPCPKEE